MVRLNVSGPPKSLDNFVVNPNLNRIDVDPSSFSAPSSRLNDVGGGGIGTGFSGRVANTWENLSQKGRNLFNGKSGFTRANSKTFEGKKLSDEVADISKNNKEMTRNGKTKSFDELSEAPDVKSASSSEASKLTRVGLKGAGAVAALMILTGNSNPITAVTEVVEGAADIGEDLGKGLGGLFKGFGDIFAFIGSYGKYASSASSCILLLIALSVALSTVKK